MPLDMITQAPSAMPLDGVDPRIFGDIPDSLNFNVEFEPTRLSSKKYVINASTGEAVGIVGSSYPNNPHPAFFRRVQAAITDNLGWNDLADAKVKWQTARNGAFGLMDITLPNVRYTVTTKEHQTDVAQRIVALHGVDGLCSNQTYFGAIDFFCTNGCISGDWGKVRKKNTSGFSLDNFIHELNDAKTDFHQHGRQLQTMADRETDLTEVRAILDRIIKHPRKVEKMSMLYLDEASTRGHNMFALHSAFTNYATYADERNGFKLKEMKNDKDTKAITMFSREQQVNKWVSDPAWSALVAA